MTRAPVFPVLALSLALCACRMQEERTAVKSSESPGSAATAQAPLAKGEKEKGRPVFLRASDLPGDVPTVVRGVLQKAAAEKREVLIYVGATWCEPCQRFHAAVERGDFDTTFPRLTLVEFDYDRDVARLDPAQCLSKYIPLFAKPTAEGQCSSQRIEGSIKGPGSVADIAPRLRGLLTQPPG